MRIFGSSTGNVMGTNVLGIVGNANINLGYTVSSSLNANGMPTTFNQSNLNYLISSSAVYPVAFKITS